MPSPGDRPSPSASLVGSNARHAYCPLCGRARVEIPAGRARVAEDALCAGRCLAAWQTLTALRQRESTEARVVMRRRGEYESGKPHAPALSDLLLQRWREGDFTVAPELLLAQIENAVKVV